MKIAIASDTWQPQVNGVVRTYENVSRELEALGHELLFITHDKFRYTFPCPTYPSIRLPLFPGRTVNTMLDQFSPDAIHIATEGPIGHAARTFCIKRGIAFTTSFHTRLPEYIRARAPIPIDWSYRYARMFHDHAEQTLVPTNNQKLLLEKHGFENIVIWSRGVNTELFYPRDKDYLDLPRPISLYMGRVAVEKNIEAFLDLDLPGSKVVVGDGPDLDMLKSRYRDAVFTGFKFGAELACHLSAADVFVFPSLTDTFGIVLLEAMACGIPVAACPVTGPIDVVINGKTGILDNDLHKAVMSALELRPQNCVDYARSFTWEQSAQMFLNNLTPFSFPGSGKVLVG